MTKKERKSLIKIIIAMILLIMVSILPVNNIVKLGLYTITYLIMGYDVVWKAIKNLFTGQVFDEHFLMSLATIGAFATGEYLEAVLVMLLYQIGELFQSYAVGKSRRQITELMDIRPDYANIEQDGKLVKVAPEEVSLGDEIVVKPGEKIPLDGIVKDGESMLDTSALTGESVPRKAKVNDTVLSGCINKTGILKIEVTKEFSESTASKILDLVENASTKKAKTENFITKFARYYTPIVVVLALCLAFLPPIFIRDLTVLDCLKRSMTFLVISCPCALVISVPLGFFGGIGGASRQGILIKGSNYLEALSNTKIIIFDKTGTLTYGKLKISEIINYSSLEKEKIMQVVGSIEKKSTHPIGKAFVEYLKEKKIEILNVENFNDISGLGITGIIDNEEYIIGNSKILVKYNIENKYTNDEEKLAKQR